MPPCVTEIPQFELVSETMQAKHEPVVFVGINTKDARAGAQNFVDDNRITYPIIFDEPGNVAVQLGGLPGQSLPDTVLIDKHGRVAGTYVVPMTPKDLEPMIARLVAEP